MPNSIEVQGVSKRFAGRLVLDEIHLDVVEGETLVILGGSGSGKSTLLRLMIGNLRCDAGDILVHQKKSLAAMSEAELDEYRKSIGVLFQSGALFNSMSVADNIALPLREHTDLPEETIEIMVKIKLELVGLREHANKMPAMLSGGMKKRAGLARAIALDPKILFYDEPSAGLDPVTSAEIDQLIIDLNRKLGVTSVVVTHEMDSAFRIADRMVLLDQGKFVAVGTAQQMRESADPLVRQFVHGLAEGPLTERRRASGYELDLLGNAESSSARPYVSPMPAPHPTPTPFPARPFAPSPAPPPLHSVPFDAGDNAVARDATTITQGVEATASDMPGAGPARYLHGRFPDFARPGEKVALQVRIALGAGPVSTALKPFSVPDEGLAVTLTIFAPQFRVLSQSFRRILVPGRADSEWTLFELQALVPGVQNVEVTAFSGGTYLGSLQCQITVDSTAPNSGSSDMRAAVDYHKGDPGEVTLEIHCDGPPGEEVYRYRWVDSDDDLEELRSEPLKQPRKELIANLVGTLNQLARGAPRRTPLQSRLAMEGIGIALWKAMIPKSLQDRFWQRRGQIERLILLSPGDPMPWELLYPTGIASAPQEFLAERIIVARRLFGRRPITRFSLGQGCLVQPSTTSPATSASEITAIQQLLTKFRVPYGPVVSLLDPLLGAIKSEPFDLLHFACHNTFLDSSLDGSTIKFDDGPFTPLLLEAFEGNLLAKAPLVFLNACRTDGQTALFTALAGWAQKFINAGAGAFIGSLWEVRDSSARSFAETFYSRLLDNDSVGNAMQTARASIKGDGSDPTWLAYTLYGDPTAKRNGA